MAPSSRTVNDLGVIKGSYLPSTTCSFFARISGIAPEALMMPATVHLDRPVTRAHTHSERALAQRRHPPVPVPSIGAPARSIRRMAIPIFASDFSRRREASRPRTETFAFSSLDGRREILSRRRAIIESFAPNGSYDPASVRRASSGKRRRWSAGFGSDRRIRSVSRNK